MPKVSCHRIATRRSGRGRDVNEIAAAFIAACRDEIEAPKPGNVHVFADGHGMTVEDFLRSAEAAAPGLVRPRRAGRRAHPRRRRGDLRGGRA